MDNEKFVVLSQLGLVASLIQFKCTKYFFDDLTRLSFRTPSVSILFQNHPQRYEKLDSY